MSHARTFAFGAFTLVPERQLLLRSGAAIRVGCRALDILLALVERPGVLVTKAELIAQVWPTVRVDESNLKVNMFALRRALEDDVNEVKYIATVKGRGYRFVAPLETTAPPSGARPE